MKAKADKRANKDCDVTEKVSRDGRNIIQEMVVKEEITQAYRKYLKPNDYRARRVSRKATSQTTPYKESCPSLDHHTRMWRRRWFQY